MHGKRVMHDTKAEAQRVEVRNVLALQNGQQAEREALLLADTISHAGQRNPSCHRVSTAAGTLCGMHANNCTPPGILTLLYP
jgi:hypothetical protein